jgi:serine/threonine protein kinase
MELSGLEIEGYEVLSKVGAGGMGMVYKAKDLKLDRFVALKLMSPSLQMDLFARRFWKEARALAKLSDPYIVSIHTFLETHLGLVIVMEYLDGVTLGEYMRRKRPISIADSLRILKQLLHGIQHAHSEGIIHRDIKPQNIIITTKDESVKLTDFGLAKIYESGDTAYTSVTGGTLHYMSPEQVSGDDDVDVRSDIYSIGITAYQMLAGSTPFPGDEKGFVIQSRIVEGNLVPLTVKNRNLPAPLVDVIMKALETRPQHRYQTAREFLGAIERFESGELEVTEISGSPGGKSGPGLRENRDALTAPTVTPVQHEAAPRQAARPEGNIFVSRTFLTMYSVLIVVLLAFSLHFSTGGNDGSGPDVPEQSGPAQPGLSDMVKTLLSAESSEVFFAHLNTFKQRGGLEAGNRNDFPDPEGLLVFVVDAEAVLAGFRFEGQSFINLKTGQSLTSLTEQFRSKRAIWVKEL